MSDQEHTSGVQELIDQLSQDGVEEGRRQAEQIVADAQRKAEQIVESAHGQAKQILEKASRDAEQMQTSGKEALRLAARDTIRDFKARIHNDFRNRLQTLVAHELKDPELIRKMILEVTRQATAGLEDGPIEILLPNAFVSDQEMRDRIERESPDALTEFIQGIIGQDLREGVQVSLGSRRHEGMTVKVADGKLEIDLTTEAITEFLSQHLMPRFRAIMDQS